MAMHSMASLPKKSFLGTLMQAVEQAIDAVLGFVMPLCSQL